MAADVGGWQIWWHDVLCLITLYLHAPSCVEDIMRSGVDNVFVLCTSRELQRSVASSNQSPRCNILLSLLLNRYGVPSLLHEFSAAGLCVNHHPIEDGSVPSTEECGQLLQQLMKSLTQYKQVLIQ